MQVLQIRIEIDGEAGGVVFGRTLFVVRRGRNVRNIHGVADRSDVEAQFGAARPHDDVIAFGLETVTQGFAEPEGAAFVGDDDVAQRDADGMLFIVEVVREISQLAFVDQIDGGLK